MLRIHRELAADVLPNCAKLSRLLEVSPKTVMRDLAFMRDRLDLPIEYDRQLYAFRYSYPVASFPTVQITAGELFALMIAQKVLEQYQGTPYHRQLTLAFEKLASGLRDRVSFNALPDEPPVSFHNLGIGKADLKTFEALSRAISGSLEVTFDYCKLQEETASRRRVQPYHLSHRENFWYLIGRDMDRDAIRQFAVARLGSVAVSRTKFLRPADFSPEKFYARSFGVFVSEGEFRVRLRFSARVARRIRERDWHETQEIKGLANGGIELTMCLGSLDEVEQWVLSWGPDVKVLEPEALIMGVKNACTDTEALYARRPNETFFAGRAASRRSSRPPLESAE